MEIILMRHYKVDMKYDEKYDSEGFDRACERYNKRPVKDQLAPRLPEYVLYASSMTRAQETARFAFQKEPIILKGVHEVTMKSYKDTKRQLPTWWWELMARVQWRSNMLRPHETYDQTMRRLESGLMELIDRNEDAIVVMHGLAMRYMVKVLRKNGFKGPIILHAKNGQAFRYRRQV
ncbi:MULTISPECIES: histidine phosphatase family protein [unclassified Fusibacter]|uniref:histidine phosphatase family protein n=1 Tax=unclassified Fusibacter TaxID=2624464 RepID=UPI0010108B08|nr:MULTISPECIES: histidine phosphatase family protein [unclassified Fusibacter]MCK8061401.1 histidine phosphatase family protein [Fusibacter sp. A2]NPE23556.1 hypothetical protein [Fusibacter sp. A1]RXV58966.1 hypothetical protein DWB64_17360 [Fusibacter sp. A1]